MTHVQDVVRRRLAYLDATERTPSTMVELARALPVDRTALSHILAGRRGAGAASLRDICAALDMTVEDMCWGRVTR